MAAQALSFCSSFCGSSNSSSSSFQQQHENQNLSPNTLSFQQRKRPRSSSSNSLSFSSSNTYINNNPNCFNLNPINPITLQTHNTNPFHTITTAYNTNPNPNNLFPTDHFYATNPSFFDPPSPQTLEPLHQEQTLWPLHDCYDPIPDFSSLDDQILLAPFLAEPEQISTAVDFPAVQESVVADVVVDVPLKKQCGGGTAVSVQSMAARERRKKITERTSELGKLIPGGNKMSTAEMFEAAYKYVKFLQAQVSLLQLLAKSNQGMKEEEQLHIKEMQILASPTIQEKLYSEEKCLVPKQFLDRTLANHHEARRNLLLRWTDDENC